MPVEIKELVIRTVVGRGGAQPQEGEDLEAPDSPQVSAAAAGPDDLVQECVRQVLRILDARKER